MAGNTRITNASFQAIVQLGAAHTQRTVADTAVALKDHTVSTSTTHVLVQFNNADIRVTFDGTTPTTTKGFLYRDGATAYWPVQLYNGAKGVRTAATSVVLEVQELNSV